MRLGIVGGGVVGHATARAFLEHVEEVRIYDVLSERRTHALADVLVCDLVMVCLPTPQQEGSLGCDTSVVERFFGETIRAHPTIAAKWNLVLRSTVPVGFTRRMAERYGLVNLVHSPEFLTARCALVDAQVPARNVIGYVGEPKLDSCLGDLHALYHRRWPHAPIHVMTSDESEAVKLMQNSFFAVKVALWNEFRTFADAAGLDWELVRNAILTDGRIHPSHTQVPGPDGRYGFGGACLPKDIANLISCILGTGAEPWVTQAAWARNGVDRQREARP